MQCAACRHENRAGARFCVGCGAPLALACAACGAELPAGARFCDACGRPCAAPPAPRRDPRAYTPKHLADKVLTTRAAVEGERKQVTVLFADVQGSMDLAEQVDAEEWHRILDRFFQILADGVHRFEGTVNQFTGDGIMALFGAPIAHEDHARRACFAALALRDELRGYADELRRAHGLNFSVRMGLNSGDVVVGRIGDDLRMDYTAQGHTVGLAQRMEQLAEAGTAYLTAHTAAHVEGYFQLADLGEFRLKGATAPLRVHRLDGVGPLRTRLDVSRARGFSKFVGRVDEMAALDAAFEQTCRGNGQVVGVVAEAGAGKSRLCWEFLERQQARGATIYRATGVAHGKAVPFLPMLELFRNYYGITDRDSAADAREKVAGRLLLLDDALREALPVVFDFLGVADPERPAPRMDPEARQRQEYAVLKRVVQVRGRRERSITLLEDLHWFDGGSDGFLEVLVESLPGTQALLVVNFRPEYHARWMQKSYYRQLPLLPLGPEATAELLDDLLGRDASLAVLARVVHERTSGNPFFIEEVVQSLVEGGTLDGARGAYRLAKPVEGLAIPGTVNAILSARIDRLPEREKQVLQTASVIGRSFPERVLRRVAEVEDDSLGDALRALTTAEFIFEEALYPEVEHAFKHPLTQEVAYGSQLAERRRHTHAAVARTIEALDAARLDERAGVLAYHWERAGEALHAARWHARAAVRTGLNNPAESAGHWRRVRELAATLPETGESTALRLHACREGLSMGLRIGQTAEERDALFAEGRVLAERAGDLCALALLETNYASALVMAGDTAGQRAHMARAAEILEGVDERNVHCSVLNQLGFSHYLAGRLADALACVERTIELTGGDLTVSAAFGVSAYVFGVWVRGLIEATQGRLAEGRADLERGIALARDAGQTENLGWAFGVSVTYAELSGDTTDARAYALQSLAIVDRLGSAFSRAFAFNSLGRAHMLADEWGPAVNALEQAVAVTHESGTAVYGRAIMLAHLARGYLGAGDPARARETAERAIALARDLGMAVTEIEAQLSLARVLLATADAAEHAAAAAALARTADLVRETGAAAYAPQVLVAQAELAGGAGDEGARRRLLEEARALFAAMGAAAHAERLGREAMP